MRQRSHWTHRESIHIFFPVFFFFSLIDCLSHLWFLLKTPDSCGWQSPRRRPSRRHPWETGKFEKQPTQTPDCGPQGRAAVSLGTQVSPGAWRDLTNRSPSGPRLPQQTCSPWSLIALDSVCELIITDPKTGVQGHRLLFLNTNNQNVSQILTSNLQSHASCKLPVG